MNARSKLAAWEEPKKPSLSLPALIMPFGHNEISAIRASLRNFPGYKLVGPCMKLIFAVFLTCVLSSSTLCGQTSASAAGSHPPVNDAGKTSAQPVLDLRPDPRGMLSEEQMRDLLRITADHDVENDKRQRDYTYIEREEQHNLDGKGRLKSTEVTTSEVLVIYGEQVERLIAKDDKPLSAKDSAKEEKKIEKIIDKRSHESDKDRQKRLAKEEKEREDGRKFVLEVADAYTFRYLGTERLDGRETYAIDAEPRPGFQPRMKYANVLPKFRFRVWIDK